MTIAFPAQLHVFVRDWLSSNNVVLRSRDGHVLIDTGYVRHAPLTLALLATPRGLGNEPLANTPEEFAKMIRRDADKWGAIGRKLGVRLD